MVTDKMLIALLLQLIHWGCTMGTGSKHALNGEFCLRKGIEL